MKMKSFFLFVIFILLVSPLIAEVSIGIEMELPDVNNAEEFPLVIKPFIEYEEDFCAFDVWARMYIPMGIAGDAKGLNDNYKEVADISINLEFDAGYYMEVGNDSVLSFGLEGELFLPITTGEDIELPLTPWIKLSEPFNIGDVYVGLKFPLEFLNTDDFSLGMDINIGWVSNFGLTLELTPHLIFLPEDDNIYAGITTAISYEKGPFLAELEFGIPYKINNGIEIDFYIEYNIDPMTFYVNFGFIGAGTGGTCFSPSIGFMYSW